MPDCKNCYQNQARLRCLKCEQEDELQKTKYTDRIFPEIIYQDLTVFPQLDLIERAIWVLYLANFSQEEVAKITYISQSAISQYIATIKKKLRV